MQHLGSCLASGKKAKVECWYKTIPVNRKKTYFSTFNWVKICAATLKSHALSCRHLNWSDETIQIKGFNCQVMSNAAVKKGLTSETIPSSCQMSVKRLWAYLAVMLWVWGQGWRMELGQEQQRLCGSPLLLPFEWKAGHWRCKDCRTEGHRWKTVSWTFRAWSLGTSVCC